MFSKISFSALLLTSLASGIAIPAVSFQYSHAGLTTRAADATAEAQILRIAPTSNTCSGASFADECATASQAAPYLIAAMIKYNIYSLPSIAGILSLIAFESGDFKFSKNHFPSPGRPGQGTRNMQMANYNLLYAQSIPELATPLKAITTASSTDGLSDDQLNGIRALVLDDQYSFASAAWFLTSQCSEDVRTQLAAGGQQGFEAYMGCVGTTATEDRLAYWERANTAFGLS